MDQSKIYLVNNLDGQLVEAQLWDGVGPTHLGQWERSWKPLMTENQRTANPCAEDAHWDWRAKHLATRSLLSQRWFTITCEEKLQGLMLVDNSLSCRIPTQFGKPLIYIDYLATAPWNRRSFEDPPRFTGVGRAFILAAIELSHEEEFQGRIGLHSLPSAKEFYSLTCGMTLLGPDAAKSDLSYLEMTPEQAENFRQNITTQ